MSVERISKPAKDNDQASQLNESMKQVRVMLESRDQTPKVLQPTDRPLDFPAAAVAPRFAAVLCGRLDAVAAMRRDQVDAAPTESGSQRITVGGQIVDQSLGQSPQYALLQKRFDQSDFMRAGAGGVDGQGKSRGIGIDHDLGAFAAFGLANLFTPFFADEKVPSANVSSWLICPARSSFRTNRDQAFTQSPVSVHALWRRQQVVGEGKCRGTSFQRAPLRNTQRMPSMHPRAGACGRPPSGPTGASGNRSEMRFHCSSVSSKLGSIVDPVGVSSARQDRFAMNDLLSAVIQYGKHHTTV